MEYFDFRDIEATKLDYKVSLEAESPRSWLKSVSAFANTDGGSILFGVTNDKHDPIGLDDPQKTASKITELINSRILPLPRYDIIPFIGKEGGRPCINLVINSGPAYPYYYSHDRSREVYIRHGDQSVLATSSEISNLVLKGQHRTYDSLQSDYKMSDVSFTLLGATFRKETGEEFVQPRDIISMGLSDENGKVTNAGLLLCDQGVLSQSKIICTRWKGTEKGDIQGDALDDQEYSGCSLIMLLNNAEQFIRNNSKNPWSIRGMRRMEQSDYPYKSVREVLVNALMHRDYQLVGTEIHVDMFDDRLEITSPGGMMNGSRIQDLDLKHVPSIRRNNIIADVFSRLGYMDRRGSGIGRILNSYSGFPRTPVFYSNEYFFLVTLPNRSVEVITDRESTCEEKRQPCLEKTQLRQGKKTQLSPEKTQLSEGKTQLSPEKTQLGVEKTQPGDTDWELKYFEDVCLGRTGGFLRERTKNRIRELFSRYRYTYTFNRRNVAELFGISENGATGFINKCMEIGIIKRIRRDEYCFVNNASDD